VPLARWLIFFEEEGLATTQISLIREHTEKIEPPRALWVPFELGRPLGVPNDAEFQTKVVLAALQLLEAASGPVLNDFPEEAPLSEDSIEGWSCPINLADEPSDLTDNQKLRLAFKREINRMRSWYDLAVKSRGRTTFSVSGLTPETIADFIGGFLDVGIPDNPRNDLPLAFVLKLAADDLKSYYLEAAAAKPGDPAPGSAALADWFWRETVAACVLRAVKESCQSNNDKMLQVTGTRLIVPMDQS